MAYESLSINKIILRREKDYKNQENQNYRNDQGNRGNKNCESLSNFSFTGENYKKFENDDKEIQINEIDKIMENIKVQPNTNISTNNTNNITYKNNNCISVSSSKMGSRRIFTPQFKIQVLESYRNDTDCKGNQRATARKYNIHRRQIQKWLQCETNLRSSIANNNPNNMKHQFHNISHQSHNNQQQQQQLTQVLTAPLIHANATYNASISKKCSDECIQLIEQYNSVLPLEAARHNVTYKEPSSQKECKTKNLETTPETQVSRDNTSSPSKLFSACKTVPLSSLETLRSPSNSLDGNSTTSLGFISASCILHQDQQQRNIHHMLYTHTPSFFLNSTAVSIPVPTTHQRSYQELPSYHCEIGASHYDSHQYHHLSRLLPTSQQSNMCSFMPSASLPMLAAFPIICNSTHSIETALPINTMSVPVDTGKNMLVKTTDSLQNDSLTGNGYMHNDEYVTGVHDTFNSSEKREDYQNIQQYYDGNYYHTIHPIDNSSKSFVSPIDLSIGRHKKRNNEDFQQLCAIVDYNPEKSGTVAYDNFLEYKNKIYPKVVCTENSIVDLTCRKRKSASENALVIESDIPPIKLSSEGIKQNDQTIPQKLINVEKAQPIKSVKLFKPYLLGENEYQNSLKNISNDPIIYNREPISHLSSNPQKLQKSYNESGNYNKSIFKTESVNNHLYAESGCSDFRTEVSEPLSVLQCPKGSPVSGYESSSSTYSESSFRSERCSEGTFNIDFRVQPIKMNDDGYHQDNVMNGKDNQNNSFSSFGLNQSCVSLSNVAKIGLQQSIILYA